MTATTRPGESSSVAHTGQQLLLLATDAAGAELRHAEGGTGIATRQPPSDATRRACLEAATAAAAAEANEASEVMEGPGAAGEGNGCDTLALLEAPFEQLAEARLDDSLTHADETGDVKDS